MAGHPPLDHKAGGHAHDHEHDPDDPTRQTRGWKSHYQLHADGGQGFEHYHLHHERTTYDHHPIDPAGDVQAAALDHAADPALD